MELKIYDKANNLRLTASPNSSSTVTEEIGGECSVSASFTHTAYVPLDVDDYIDLEGVRYKVKSRYRPKQKNTQTYEYSVKFYAPLHDAEDTLMLFQEGGTTSEFSYDGSAREHLQLWIDNMNRRAGAKLWSIGTVIDSGSKTISYRNVKCWDAAFGSNGIASTFDTEMWADGYVINLCKAERGETVELGYLHGLTNLAQEDNGEVKFFTRLFPLGSTRNIDATKYGYSRLQLPDRSLYVDKNVDLYGVKEETEEAAFSTIFPKYVGTVSSVRTKEKISEEGRKYIIYYFKDNDMTWDPKDYEIPDLDYMLQFQTGELAGRGTNGSFQAAWHEDTKEWEIINVYPDETTQIPGGVIVPNPGDQYIPWNFAMPQEYITAAEQEYKQAVNDFLNTYSFDPNKYNGTTDRNYIEKNGTPLRIGWNVRLLSEQYFGSTGGYKNTRIIKVQRKLNDLCQATITCSDEVGSGWKSSVDNSLGSLQDANHNLSQSYEKLHNDMMEGFASIKNLWELKQDDYGNYYIYTKYNILGRKGITSYAEADVKVPSVFDGLPLDNTTIRKNPETGLIEVIGGTGTSFDENAMWSALSGSSNNQINKSHLTTVLAEYATAESVSALTTELNKKWTQDDTKIKNWDTAFGWGDHSKAGYAHLANEEAFTGLKHFTAGLSVGESKKKIYEENGVVYIDADVAVTGAMTFYASAGRSVSTIMDGVTVDEETITKGSDNVLRIKNAGAGSSFDENAMWSALSGSSDNQINKSHLTTALTGYATESWVSGKNYAVKATTLAGYGITDGVNDVSVTGTGNAVTAASISGHTLTLTKGSTFSLSGHKHAWDDITSGKPSTLSGYGITDAYTKTESDSKYPTKTGSGASGTWGINVTGNAGTATKLQTARSLWGNNFDGTANISGDITLAIGKGIYLSANDERWLLQTKRSDNTQINGIKTNGFQMCTYFGDTKTMQFSNDRIYSYVDFRAEKDLYINGIRLHKSADGVITLEGNLAVTGGVTMYAIDPVSVSTVMDGVVVDGTTIKKENGKLVAVGGGEAGSVAWGNISGKPSVFATNIANITDLHSSWDSVLAAQKPAWLTAVSIATISDLNSGWDALLKAAPSAYVTRWPTISEVTSKQNLVVKLNGGTTEGTNQFTYNATGAKTINITPAGIGAAASSHNHSWSNITSGKPTTLAGYGITDAPTKTGSGASGTWGIGITGNAGSASKLQTTHTIWGQNFNGTQNVSGEISTCTRIRNSDDSPLYLGNSNNASWVYTQDIASHNGVENWAIGITGTAWFQNVNIGYAHPATGNHPLNVNGVISGYAYTGRNIRIECDNAGNNLEARASEINNYNGKLYLQHDTSQDLICCKGGGRVGIGIDVPNAKLHVIGAIYTSEIVSAYGYTGNHVRIECDNNGSNTAARIDEVNNYMAPLYLQHNTGNNLICCNGGGNVGIGTTSPAAKLDINGDIFCRSIESTYTSTANEEFSIDRSNLWCKAVPVIPNYKYRYVLGWQDRMAGGWTTGYGIGTYRSNDGSWGSMTFEVCQYETSKTRKAQLEIRGRDNVLWFSGDILTEGGSSFYGSDIRYKSITQQVKLSLSDIAKAPSFVYHWNREGMKCDRLNLGGSAQYTQSVLPWAVEDNSNFLMMDYATVAYTFAVHTARHLLTYESRTDKKIKKLEREIVILKKQLKKLGYEEVRILDDSGI